MMHAVFGNNVSICPEVDQNRTSSTLHIKVNLALWEIISDFLSSFINVTCEIHITLNDKTGLQCKPWSPPNLSSLKLCVRCCITVLKIDGRRLSKQLLHGDLKQGEHIIGQQKKYFKDTVDHSQETIASVNAVIRNEWFLHSYTKCK